MTVEKAERGRGRNVLRACVAALLLAGVTGPIVATTVDLPVAAATPSTTMPADEHGYVNSPARCAGNQTAVLTGRTALSLVAICADGRGHYEYRGMRLSDRATLVLPANPMSNGCFGARADAVTFTVSDRKLLLTKGLHVLRDENMLESRDYRDPSATPVASQDRAASVVLTPRGATT